MGRKSANKNGKGFAKKINIALNQEQVEKWESLGKGDWLRRELDSINIDMERVAANLFDDVKNSFEDVVNQLITLTAMFDVSKAEIETWAANGLRRHHLKKH